MESPSDIQAFSDAFNRFREEKRSFEQEDWSEADTRSKWIDFLFFDCLGWHERDVRRESGDNGLRLDYLFSIVVPTLVVEAKKAATSFPLLNSRAPYRVKLKTLRESQPTLRPSLDQAAGYCHLWSTPYAVVTNGRSVITFMGNRDDSLQLWQGNAFVITDLFDEKFNFADLYNLLSKRAVQDKSLSRKLGGRETSITAKSVLATYSNPDATAPREALSQALEPVLERLFTDIVDDRRDDVLIDCYVKPGTARLRDVELELPLLDEPPKQSNTTIDISSRHSFDKFELEFDRKIKSQLNPASTLLLIGNVGVGKSMFLRRFFSPKRQDRVIPPNTQPFFIDFRGVSAHVDNLENVVFEALRKQVDDLDVLFGKSQSGIDLSSIEALSNIFEAELELFNRTAKLLSNDPPEYNKALYGRFESLRRDTTVYLSRVFAYFRRCPHPILPCIVLDNADHHDPDFQRRVYLLAKELQTRLNCLTIVSLQESWYWHFRDPKGPLAGYHDTVFHLPAPRVKDVIARRIDVAIKRIDDYVPGDFLVNVGGNVTIQPVRVADYLGHCKSTLFENAETSIGFECLANGNVRRGLDLFCQFVRCDRATTQRYVMTVTGGESTKPKTLDELIRIIACGDFLYYSGIRSNIPNVFTLFQGIISDQLPRMTALFILELLAGHSADSVASVGRGFVARNEIIDLLKASGVPEDVHLAVIERLVRSGLVLPNIVSPLHDTTAPFYRISALGSLICRKLIYCRSFWECVMIDTPISDKNRMSQLLKLLPEGAEWPPSNVVNAIDIVAQDLRVIELHETTRLHDHPIMDSYVSLRQRLINVVQK